MSATENKYDDDRKKGMNEWIKKTARKAENETLYDLERETMCVCVCVCVWMI